MSASRYTRDDYNALSDDDFRALVRDFLAERHPPELRNPVKRLHWAEAKPWYMELSRHGWLAPNWPKLSTPLISSVRSAPSIRMSAPSLNRIRL